MKYYFEFRYIVYLGVRLKPYMIRVQEFTTEINSLDRKDYQDLWDRKDIQEKKNLYKIFVESKYPDNRVRFHEFRIGRIEPDPDSDID